MATNKDKAVLNAIFNPLLPVGTPVDDGEESKNDEEADITCDDEASQKAKEYEVAGVKFAEVGDLDEAIRCFTDAISACPTRPSCFNNRAQAFRLKRNIEGAKADLNTAIELSHGSGKVARQAYTQRALIYRLLGNDDEAKRDFESAAALGSDFAKSQLVAMNPYAAMCNKMLCDVMGRLKRGEPEDQSTESHPAA